MYDNSKDALAAIMREHGAEVLLGSRLKNFFNDYAPGMKGVQKNAVSLVYDSGAAEILKKNLGAGAEEQEIAFRRAVQKMVDEYPVERSRAESIILEFTAALGWKVNIQPQEPPVQPPKEKQRQLSPTQKKQQTPPAPQKQPLSVQATGNLKAGQRNVQFGNYLWRVLDVKNGKALLLTEDILEQRWYHSPGVRVTWETCELRKYLNGEFLRSFSSQEQSRIAQTENTNKDNQWFGTFGGRSTVDWVFLLSIEEVVKYFGDSGQLRKRPKAWGIVDQYKSARVAKYKGKAAWWWLRSPGRNGILAAFVYSGGSLDMNGDSVDRGGGGVRPVLWLNL